MFSELLITDGSTVIDLLAANRGSGIGLVRYTPGRPNLKAGGIWQDSPLGSGRRMVHGVRANVNDALELRIGYSSHVALIGEMQRLDLLLEKATAYWTQDWQNEPVYLKAKAAGESSYRYALIHRAEFPNYPDPYDQPYASSGKRFVLDGLILGLERSEWLGNPPGEGTTLTISNTAHTGTSLYVGNGYSASGITQIRRYTETGGATYSGNLTSASLPYNLLDAAGVAAEDFTTAIYFGSPFPFTSVIFDIGTTALNLNMVWEVSVGSGNYTDVTAISGAKPLRDETDNFSLPGIHIVQWYNTNGWIQQALSSFGVLFWIRARLASVDVGTLRAPTQQNSQPYTAKLPYAEITLVNGDLDALAAIQISVKNRENEATLLTRQVMMGLRSLTRGGVDCSDFSAYINPRTADNPTGVSIDVSQTTSHGNATTLAEVFYKSPTSRALVYTATAGDVLDEMFRVNFDSSIVRQYYGVYRLFAKAYVFDRSTTNQLRARIKFFNAYHEWTGETVTLTDAMFTDADLALVELGRIQLPPMTNINAGDESGTVSLVIDALCSLQAGGGIQSMEVYELILLPVDEWAATATGQTNDDQGDIKLDLDSVGHPKQAIRAMVRDPDNDQVIDSFALVSTGPVALPANNDQRIWFLQKHVDPHFGTASEITIQVNPRFHFLRGD